MSCCPASEGGLPSDQALHVPFCIFRIVYPASYISSHSPYTAMILTQLNCSSLHAYHICITSLRFLTV